MSYSLDFNDLTTENPMFGYLMGKIFGTRNQRYLKSLRPLLRKINALEPEMQVLADEELAPRNTAARPRRKGAVSTNCCPKSLLLCGKPRAASSACVIMTCSLWAASCCTRAR